MPAGAGASAAAADADAGGAHGLSAYERERAERVRRNAAALAALRVREAAARLAAGGPLPPPPAAKKERRAKRKSPAAGPAPTPARRSRRRGRGGPAPGGPGGAGAAEDLAAEAAPRLLTAEEYFAARPALGVDPARALRTDGRFRGGANPAVLARHGGASAKAGGGAGSRAPAKKQRPAGWSAAKARSAAQLRANPNAFFYRHVAPGEAPATGAWSAAEAARFLAVARAHGVGDRWGEFASWVGGGRVGYQCSGFYRAVAVARGLVVDPRFRFTPGGAVVFVG